MATLGLVLVLFTDAIGVDIAEFRQQRRFAALILGPGTLLPAALTAPGCCSLPDGMKSRFAASLLHGDSHRTRCVGASLISIASRCATG
jgi:NhaP-type Na+/H+ or K+/H+ antiporter